MKNLFNKLLLLPALFLAATAVAYDFNDCTPPPGFSFPGSGNVGRIADDGTGSNCVVHLTDINQGAAFGVFSIPAPAGGSNVDNIHLHWRSLVGGDNGSLCTFAQFNRFGADGYSMSWGTDLPNPPSYGNPGEEGAGTGLIVTVDTFDNGGGEAPGLEIKWRGARVAFDNINADPGLAKDFLRQGVFVEADLSVDTAGHATFIYNGRVLTATLTNWTGIAGGNLMFAARTGGACDNHWIDDIAITRADPLSPDFFDRNDVGLTPHGSRPDNNVVGRAGRLGGDGPFAWQTAVTPGSLLVARSIRVRELNFHADSDVDWFSVIPSADLQSTNCDAELTIGAGPGVRMTVFHAGSPEVVAEGTGRVTMPASLLFGSELCLRLAPQFPSWPATYNLELRLTELNPVCEAFGRVRAGRPPAGGFGRLGASGQVRFPGVFPNFPAGPIPWCDPRICDPAQWQGRRDFDAAGRIISADSYLIEWPTFGGFNALIELLAGTSLRGELLDAQGQVMATAATLSGPNLTNVPRSLLTLRLDREFLLPGYYFLKIDHGLPGTVLNVLLPRAAVAEGGLAFEDLPAVPSQSAPPAFADWARAMIPESSDLSAEGDPDHDGWNNLQEYAFGSNPLISGDTQQPSIQIPAQAGKGELELRFIRPSWASDLSYHLEGARTLTEPITWQPVPPAQTLCRPLPDRPGFEEVTWKFAWAENVGFFRPVARFLYVPPPNLGESLRVGFYNAQFLAEPFTDDSPCCDGVDNRAVRIAHRIIATGFDVIALCEVFTDGPKEDLVKVLQPFYPYYVKQLDDKDPSPFQDSGLMLFSKFPFVALPVPAPPANFQGDVQAFTPAGAWGSVAFASFTDLAPFGCWGSDCLANKGAGLVRIQHPSSGRIYNVVFTHLQASADSDDFPLFLEIDARRQQLRFIERLVREVLGSVVQTQPLLVLGDLNINGNDTVPILNGVQHTSEYQSHFGAEGGFIIHLGADGVSDPLPLPDVWEAQNTLAEGLSDRCRDSGRTSNAQMPAETRARLDYLFTRIPNQQLAVQHMARAYGLKDFSPFYPVAFGTEGRQILSDHFGIIADINIRLPHCTPADAERVLFNPTAVGGDRRMLNRRLERPGAMQWFRLDQAGTYSISLDSPAGGVEFQVYATFELSRPLSPDPPREGIDLPLDPHNTPRTVPVRFTSQDGCPLLIRVSHRDRAKASDFTLDVRASFGLTRETAIELHANRPAVHVVPWQPSSNPGHVEIVPGTVGETYQRWFHVITEKANSGAPQNLEARFEPRGGGAYSVKWITAAGIELASGPSPLRRAFVGGVETYLLVEFSAGATAFELDWSTDLTVLLTDDNVVCGGGNSLAIHCADDTDGLLCGDDDDVRLVMEIRGVTTIGVLGPHLITTDFEEGQTYGIGKAFTNPIRFLPGETLVVALLEDDSGSGCSPDDILLSPVPGLGREMEFYCNGDTALNGEDGDTTFFYRLGHRSQ